MCKAQPSLGQEKGGLEGEVAAQEVRCTQTFWKQFLLPFSTWYHPTVHPRIKAVFCSFLTSL